MHADRSKNGLKNDILQLGRARIHAALLLPRQLVQDKFIEIEWSLNSQAVYVKITS